jgi:hypothetical protein
MLGFPLEVTCPMSQNDLIHLDSHYQQWKGTRGKALPAKLDPFNYYCIEQFMKHFDLSDEEILNGITDGGNDGGADAIYFLVNRDVVWEDTELAPKAALTVDLIFFQIKSNQGFSHTEIDKLVFLTDDFLDLSAPIDKDMALKYNPKVLEIMRIFKEKYPPISGNFPAVRVDYYYVTKADEAKPHQNATNSGTRVTVRAKTHLSKAESTFTFANAQRLLEQVQSRLPDTRELIWNEAPMQTNEGYVGLVTLPDYFKFIRDANGELARRIFESNVRGWQENTAVNRQIKTTLSSDAKVNFWLLNNGITILAAKVASAGPKRLSVKGPQVVNGLQTSRAIYDYFSSHHPQSDSRSILVRVIETENSEVFDAVVKATNSQNKMPPASLRATDQIHRQIEELFRQYDLYYDRRKGVHKDEGRPVAKIVAVSEVLQAVVAMLLQRPDDARARPGNYVTDDTRYETVFGQDTYPLVMYLKVTQIMRKVEDVLLQKIDLEYGDRRNIRFYVAAVLVSELTKCVAPSADILAAIDMTTVSDEAIQRAYERVWKKYTKLGADDAVSKGTDLLKKLQADLKRKFSRLVAVSC